MVNPIDGLLGKTEFLPSIATVKEWLDKEAAWGESAAFRQKQIEQQLADRATDPPMSPEERERCGDLWRRVKLKMQARAPDNVDWKRTQRHGPQQLLQALDNLEAMRPTASEVAE